MISDHLGSPVMVVDAENATPVLYREYDAFGNITRAVGAETSNLDAFGFAGGQMDPDTGLIRIGARDYDPAIGRWTTPDRRFPVHKSNTYVYADGDPVNRFDVMGQLLRCSRNFWPRLR